jgi:valyl-tRNA synthetase
VAGLELDRVEAVLQPPAGDALEDRWIFHRLNDVAARIDQAQQTYRYHEVADLVWTFLWDEFCDWYVEVKKLRIQMDEANARLHLDNLLRVFEYALRLLHPVMPFLTEELWQRLVPQRPGLPESICVAPFPVANPVLTDSESAASFALLQELVVEQRALRADNKIDPKQRVDALVHPRSERAAALLAGQRPILERLANTSVQVSGEPLTAGGARSKPEFDVLLQLGGAQADAMRQRLQKEIEQLAKVIESSRRQLSSEAFLAKAPPTVVEGLRTKLSEYEEQLAKNRETLAAMS